jgi:hypothetical protein
MYLYAREGLGQCPVTLQSRKLGRWGSSSGAAASAMDGFGQPLPQTSISKYRLEEVVRAIRGLPEGRVCVTPERAPEHERRIVEKLRKQGFRDWEIEAGLNLVRNDLGLPARPSPQPIGIRPPQTRMDPAGPQRQYDRAMAENLDRLYRRAAAGDHGAARALEDALEQILNDRARLAAIRQLLTELRSPAAIVLRVPPEPPAPTPDPRVRWWLPPRPARRR